MPVDFGDLPFLIKRDGTWLYRGDTIARKELVILFSSVLKRDEDGTYLLETPTERGRIEVEDVPFLAVELDRTGYGYEQVLSFRTNVGQVVIAGPEHPIRVAHDTLTGESMLYILVHPGAGSLGIEARISRSVYHELVATAATQRIEGRQMLGVWSQGRFFPLGVYEDDGIEPGGSAASDGLGHQSATIESDWTTEIEAGVQALDVRADELLAVAQRAAKMANERGDEIDAMLVKIREARVEMAVD